MKILEHISIPSYGNKSLAITCSLVSCQVEVPLMLFSYLDNYKKSTSKRRKTSNLHFEKRLSIVHLFEFFGGQCRNLESINGLFKLLIYVCECLFKSQNQNSYSNPINISVEVHQGFVLSPCLFIIVMEALSCDLRTGFPWELLYTDDLVIVAESLGELKVRLKNWKDGLEEKGLKVNIGKTKVLCSRHDVSKLKIVSVKFP